MIWLETRHLRSTGNSFPCGLSKGDGSYVCDVSLEGGGVSPLPVFVPKPNNRRVGSILRQSRVTSFMDDHIRSDTTQNAVPMSHGLSNDYGT